MKKSTVVRRQAKSIFAMVPMVCSGRGDDEVWDREILREYENDIYYYSTRGVDRLRNSRRIFFTFFLHVVSVGTNCTVFNSSGDVVSGKKYPKKKVGVFAELEGGRESELS